MGSDSIDGGVGVDTLYLYAQADGISLANASDSQITGLEVIGAENGYVNLARQTEGFSIMGSHDVATTIVGSQGDDRIGGSYYYDNNLDGGPGNDYLAGGRSNDTIKGGSGNDTFQNFIGIDTLDGGDGIDTLLIQSALEIPGLIQATDSQVVNIENINAEGGYVDLHTQSDGFHITGNRHVSNNLTGSTGNDTITAGFHPDTINCSAGDDRVIVLAHSGGHDIVAGGSGKDAIDLSGAMMGLDFTLNASTVDTTVDLSSAGLGIITYRNMESVIGSNYADTIRCGDGVVSISTGFGDDSIFINTISSSINPTTIDGGVGYDTLFMQYHFGILGDTQINGIEVVRPIDNNAQFKAKLSYQSENMTIIGGNYLNYIGGGGGNDTLLGGIYSDSFYLSSGMDTVDGGAGEDRLSISDATQGVTFTIVQNADYTTVDLSAYGLGVVSYKNIEGVWDSPYNDIIFGSSGDDSVVVTTGYNIVDAGAGNDYIVIAGVSVIDGGSGIDNVHLGQHDVNPYVLSDSELMNVESVNAGSGTADMSLQSENMSIKGNTILSNVLIGGTGADYIYGGRANDLLRGGGE